MTVLRYKATIKGERIVPDYLSYRMCKYERCNVLFHANSPNKTFCSDLCRNRSYNKVKDTTFPARSKSGDIILHEVVPFHTNHCSECVRIMEEHMILPSLIPLECECGGQIHISQVAKFTTNETTRIPGQFEIWCDECQAGWKQYLKNKENQ